MVRQIASQARLPRSRHAITDDIENVPVVPVVPVAHTRSSKPPLTDQGNLGGTSVRHVAVDRRLPKGKVTQLGKGAADRSATLLTPPTSQEMGEETLGDLNINLDSIVLITTRIMPAPAPTDISPSSSSSSRKRQRSIDMASQPPPAAFSPNTRVKKQAKPLVAPNTLKRTRASVVAQTANPADSPNPRARKRASPPLPTTPLRKTTSRAPAKTEARPRKKHSLAATRRRKSTPFPPTSHNNEPLRPRSPTEDPILLYQRDPSIEQFRYVNRAGGTSTRQPRVSITGYDTIRWDDGEVPKEEDEDLQQQQSMNMHLNEMSSAWGDDDVGENRNADDYTVPLAREPETPSSGRTGRTRRPPTPRRATGVGLGTARGNGLPSPGPSTSPPGHTSLEEDGSVPEEPQQEQPESEMEHTLSAFIAAAESEEQQQRQLRAPRFSTSTALGASDSHSPTYRTSFSHLPLATPTRAKIMPLRSPYVLVDLDEKETVYSSSPVGSPSTAERAADEEREERDAVAETDFQMMGDRSDDSDEEKREEDDEADEGEEPEDGQAADPAVEDDDGEEEEKEEQHMHAEEEYDDDDEVSGAGTEEEADLSMDVVEREITVMIEAPVVVLPRASAPLPPPSPPPPPPAPAPPPPAPTTTIQASSHIPTAATRPGPVRAPIASRQTPAPPSAAPTAAQHIAPPTAPPPAPTTIQDLARTRVAPAIAPAALLLAPGQIGARSRLPAPAPTSTASTHSATVAPPPPTVTRIVNHSVVRERAAVLQDELEGLRSRAQVSEAQARDARPSSEPELRVMPQPQPDVVRDEGRDSSVTVPKDPIPKQTASTASLEVAAEVAPPKIDKGKARAVDLSPQKELRRRPSLGPPVRVSAAARPMYQDVIVAVQDKEEADDSNEELDDNEVKIISKNPKLAAKAAAFLKLHHNFIIDDEEEEADNEPAERGRARRRNSGARAASRSRSRRRTSIPLADGTIQEISVDELLRETEREILLDELKSKPLPKPSPSKMAAGTRRESDSVRRADLHDWTRRDWKRLELCFLEARASMAEDEGVSVQEIYPEKVNAEAVVTQFLTDEGVEAQPEGEWAWKTLVRRIDALRKKSAAGRAPLVLPRSTGPTVRSAIRQQPLPARTYGNILQQARKVASGARPAAAPSPATTRRIFAQRLQGAGRSRPAQDTSPIGPLVGATPPRVAQLEMRQVSQSVVVPLVSRAADAATAGPHTTAPALNPAPQPIPIPQSLFPLNGRRRSSGESVRDLIRSFEEIKQVQDAEQERVANLRRVGSSSSMRRAATVEEPKLEAWDDSEEPEEHEESEEPMEQQGFIRRKSWMPGWLG